MISTAPITGAILRVDGREYPIHALNEFGFSVPERLDGVPTGSTTNATLALRDDEYEIEFRVRRMSEFTKCSFWKLPIRTAEKIKRFSSSLNQIASGNEQLENRSYDELASGITSERSSGGAESDSPDQRGRVKSLALMLLIFGMLGVGVMAMAFLKTRNSLDVSNAALVGNYLPVNVRVAGEVLEVFCQEGDIVNKGDVLMLLKNNELEFTYQNLVAERDSAAAKVVAIQTQLKSFENKLAIASEKLGLDLRVAKARQAHAEKTLEMYQTSLQRMRSGLQTGAITQLEYDEVDSALLAAKALVEAEKAAVSSIELSQNAVKSDVLILGDRVDDQLGNLKADLSVAQADLRQFEVMVQIARDQTKQLEITAPREGQIYATYKQVGEYLKEADQVVAISYPGRVWAAGQVTSVQASRIRPGQEVKVSVPALNMRLDGIVTAVGHRAVYSKGNYNADFRGATATDVPVKVELPELPEGVPSGIRLEMAIVTGFGVEWLDGMLGHTIHENYRPERFDLDRSEMVADNAGEPADTDFPIRDVTLTVDESDSSKDETLLNTESGVTRDR